MLLEATITPLTSLPTAHPSPEALRADTLAGRRSAPSNGGRFTRDAARVTATAAARRPRR
jgi:hypothetical protein